MASSRSQAVLWVVIVASTMIAIHFMVGLAMTAVPFGTNITMDAWWIQSVGFISAIVIGGGPAAALWPVRKDGDE